MNNFENSKPNKISFFVIRRIHHLIAYQTYHLQVTKIIGIVHGAVKHSFEVEVNQVHEKRQS